MIKRELPGILRRRMVLRMDACCIREQPESEGVQPVPPSVALCLVRTHVTHVSGLYPIAGSVVAIPDRVPAVDDEPHDRTIMELDVGLKLVEAPLAASVDGAMISASLRVDAEALRTCRMRRCGCRQARFPRSIRMGFQELVWVAGALADPCSGGLAAAFQTPGSPLLGGSGSPGPGQAAAVFLGKCKRSGTTAQSSFQRGPERERCTDHRPESPIPGERGCSFLQLPTQILEARF
jgi:hypothetical protein